jgi:hypothetical protein
VSGVTLRNFPLAAVVKFFYLVASAALPLDAFVSDKLIFNGNEDRFPTTSRSAYTFGTWTGNAPLILTRPSIRFVHFLNYQEVEEDIGEGSSTVPNKLSLNISFTVIASNRFNMSIYSANKQQLDEFRMSLFIYDQAVFSAININVRSGFQFAAPYAIGTTPLQHFTTGGWPNYPGMTHLVGLAGFEILTGTFGFDLRIDILAYSDTLTVTFENLLWTSSAIPRLEVSYLTISQIGCPNQGALVDQALTTCLTSCPAGYNPSTTPKPFIGLYTCELCTTCCPTGQYLNGSCINCQVDCLLCSTAANCITCAPGMTLDATNTCV